VLDRGYQDYSLFRDILDAGSSFIGRVKDNIAYIVAEERELTPEARAAGVIRDVVLSRLGTSHHKDELKQPVRLVIIATTDDNGKPIELWLVTDRLDLPAEFVGLAYRYRWTVELLPTASKPGDDRCWHPCRDAKHSIGAPYRWCRCAQPPANRCEASGFKTTRPKPTGRRSASPFNSACHQNGGSSSQFGERTCSSMRLCRSARRATSWG
jgi:hypothetical protein